MGGVKTKIQGSSMVEILVASVIILLCFSLFATIFSDVLSLKKNTFKQATKTKTKRAVYTHPVYSKSLIQHDITLSENGDTLSSILKIVPQ